jgi:putative flippase GtrA
MLYVLVMKDIRQVVTAGLNGAVATAVDVGSLILLHGHLHVPVAAAAFVASTAGGVTNFVMNKYLAFHDHSRVTPRQLARFGGVALVTACLLALTMQIVSVWLGVEYVVAKILCAAIVFVIWTYPAQRKLVFKRSAGLQSPPFAHAHAH